MGFPGGSDGKKSACNTGDAASTPGWGRSPDEGHGDPLLYSCLENPVDRGAWQATVHGVTKSQTHFHISYRRITQFLEGEKKASSLSFQKWLETRGEPRELLYVSSSGNCTLRKLSSWLLALPSPCCYLDAHLRPEWVPHALPLPLTS